VSQEHDFGRRTGDFHRHVDRRLARRLDAFA
jgi:hypothetical protein